MTGHLTAGHQVAGLVGHSVLVAGASSGIGRATALAAAGAGARVCLLARRDDLLTEVVAEIGAAGGEAVQLAGDATDPEVAAAAVALAADRFGTLDALVNAVGTNIPDRALGRLSLESWHDLVAANLDPAYALTQAVLPVFRARGGGLIVHVASASVKRPDVSGVGYQAAKAGVAALAHGTMEEERSAGVRVSVIYPGMTDTDLLRRRPVPPGPADLARALQPEDVALLCTTVLALPPRAHVPEILLLPAR